MNTKQRSTAYALSFASALPNLQKIAREHGYALAVHGSMSRDFDLIAAPWIEDASDAFTLIEALREAVDGVIGVPSNAEHNPAWKPHGRLAWTIYPAGEARVYMDISVMPRRREGEHYDNEDFRRTEKEWKSSSEHFGE